MHFQQVYQDVPVLGGELNVQLTDTNELVVANGEVLPGVSLDTEPDVGADEARETALAKIAKNREVRAGDLNATDPELWIYDPAVLGGPGLPGPKLVWRMDVTPNGLDHFNELVLVDAEMGNVALNFNQVENAKNRQVCDANNTSGQYPCTTPVRVEGGPVHSVADVNFAYDFAGDTYDFYSTNHGRDSIDNAGMTLKSTVRYCEPGFACPYANAFWDGNQMAYGQGFAAADDVVGHELTHGVTEHESKLFYYYQSGAINESLPDVWGEFVDLTNTSGTDTTTTRWLMGEDIPGIGAIRDMENPPAFSNPDRMQSSFYTADSSEQDGGGVHTNSGVNNKAAFLMTDGATFNGVTVTGLGISKVAKIYYEVQTNLLTSASDYNDLYGALQQACTNLTGTSGITASDCQEVKDAVDATQMNLQPTTVGAAPAPEAPVYDTGQVANTLFFDDLENPASSNWASQAITGANHWYYPQPSGWKYATSGDTNFFGWDQNATGNYFIARTGNVTPPAGKTTYLRFNHSYGFEDSSTTAFDGGVLEYSTNNGSSWNDAGSLIVNNGYNGTLSSSNPLGARQAFVRESNGYTSSRVNLSSLAGQNVRYRFRIGTDSSVSDYGWFVDDVRVYTCDVPDTIPPDAPIINSPANNSYDTDGNLTVSGTAEAGSTVNLVEEGNSDPVGTGTANPTSGEWSITLSGVSEGSHTYTAKAKDAAGNTSEPSDALTVTVDTLAPSAPTITSPANNSFDRDGAITFSGTAEANSTVEVFEGDASRDTTTANSSGAWSMTLNGVPNGPHSYTAKATDAANNTSNSSTILTVRVDTVKPSGTVLINNGAASTASRSVTLKLNATDPAPASGVAKMRFSNNGTTWSGWEAYARSKSWTLTSGAGTKTVYVQYKDRAGNISAKAKDSITYRP